jgi:ATP-dependent exoDNAse (exonuclease V) beta subunit
VYCPKLFHWQHELRIHPARPSGGAAGGSSASILPAAMLGTFLHRCMELLDQAGPWPAAACTALAARVRVEQELACPLDDLARELAAALAVLEGHPLRAELASARCRLSELYFVSRQAGLTIAGQIDQLFEDACGAWNIIDYKSDRVGPEGLAAHARRYELQMMLYGQAATRHLATLRRGGAGSPVDARLYFLRTGAVHRFDWAGDSPEGLERQLADVAAELAACRRSGHYRAHAGDGCRFCPYQSLCRS